MLRRISGHATRIVLEHDPAVDMVEDEYQAYRDSLYPWDSVKLVDGERPTVWTIRGMTRVQKRNAFALFDNQLAYLEFVVRCGLLAVDAYEVDGAPVKVERKGYGENGEMVTPKSMDALDLATEDLTAIGSAIMALSDARPFSPKRSDPQPGASE